MLLGIWLIAQDQNRLRHMGEPVSVRSIGLIIF